MLSPEEIHQKAEQERQKQAIRARKQNRSPRAKIYRPLHPESRRVFHRIYPHQPDFRLWVLLPLMLCTVGFTMYLIDRRHFAWMLPYSIGLCAVPVAAYLFTMLREWIDYRTYKNWRINLGFPVHGWDRLGESEKFPRYKYWDNLSVTVQLKPNAAAGTVKLVDDVLFLFAAAASGSFYVADQVQPGASGDLRKKWGKTGPLTVSGSANSMVMGQLYLCIQQHLRVVQLQTHSIESVHLAFSKNIFEVQQIQISD